MRADIVLGARFPDYELPTTWEYADGLLRTSARSIERMPAGIESPRVSRRLSPPPERGP
jgi:hypothetical protein